MTSHLNLFIHGREYQQNFKTKIPEFTQLLNSVFSLFYLYYLSDVNKLKKNLCYIRKCLQFLFCYFIHDKLDLCLLVFTIFFYLLTAQNKVIVVKKEMPGQ